MFCFILPDTSLTGICSKCVYIDKVSREDEMTVFERDKIKYAGVMSRVDAQARTVFRLDRRGFSLVELITVLGIVAALAVIAIPSYTAYTLTVKNNRCVADIRTIDKAVLSYYLDNNSLPVNLSDIGVAANQLDSWGRPYIYQNLVISDANALEDQFGVALNTDYDLYSKGLDGISGSLYTDTGSGDDIARFNNGAFVGLRNPD
ncbi:MAG: type II secretion system protein GspG [Oryzomonas sp.]|uniref:type II secretion system protein GspG n=1 Tax=Oryzomonas sp. TaxID=2855186 RepID=UPI002845C622|nr:type II secretion system protein GspG [Oryzomonas sp.]MDR3579272.1 type II secretion system protein GspG [Oryzomonas sp.]